MIVLVTGGRRYADKSKVFSVLDWLNKREAISLVVHGACPVEEGGADLLAEAWAKDRCVPYMGMPADKTRWPKAGPERNTLMTEYVRTRMRRICIAFPGGNGTKDCVAKARACGIRVHEVKP